MIRFLSRDIQKSSDELRAELEAQRTRFLAATQSALQEIGQEFKRRPGIALGLVLTAMVLTRPRPTPSDANTPVAPTEKKPPTPPTLDIRTVA